MANDESPAGFLSRWSRRKADVREGRPLDEPKPVALQTPPTIPPVSEAGVGEVAATAEPQPKPAPTLSDVQQLTPDSDYASFMARGVAPDVKNAAMKKLFADPHFNVMDRMDIYIDDYSQPDPLPLAMLRQMTSAKTLKLFDDEEQSPTTTNASDMPDTQDVKVVAQSVPAENNSNIEPLTNDHADLRLQPDPTPRPEGPEPKPV